MSRLFKYSRINNEKHWYERNKTTYISDYLYTSAIHQTERNGNSWNGNKWIMAKDWVAGYQSKAYATAEAVSFVCGGSGFHCIAFCSWVYSFWLSEWSSCESIGGVCRVDKRTGGRGYKWDQTYVVRWKRDVGRRKFRYCLFTGWNCIDKWRYGWTADNQLQAERVNQSNCDSKREKSPTYVVRWYAYVD